MVLQGRSMDEMLVISVDFSMGGSEIYEGIAEQLQGLDIGVLGMLLHI